jgi:hypothetical protein
MNNKNINASLENRSLSKAIFQEISNSGGVFW